MQETKGTSPERDLEKDVGRASIVEEVEDRQAPTYVVDPVAEKRLVRRIDLRIVPASMAIYLLCFLDRSNIGNARILNSDAGDSLAQALHISDREYLIALMIFFVSYTLFETPSTYMLKRFRPSRWIAFLMLGWGASTMALGALHGFPALVAVRLLIGAFEAGFFPGMVYCLTFWYRPEERAVRIALIVACATLGGAFGGAVAFAVGALDRARGLQAWRWLFVIEGAPSCAGAALVWLAFPDYPETARWLSPDERALATERIRGVASLGHARITWGEARATLRDWRLYVHYLTFVAISVPFSSMSLFSPTIVAGLGYEGLQAQLFTVPPYAIASAITVSVAYASDRYEMRSVGTGVCMLFAGAAFAVEGALEPTAFKLRYGFFVVALSFAFACIPPLLSWLTANLRGTGAATLAVPLNVSVGQIGSFIGIYIYKSNESPGYPTGHYTNAGFMLMGAAAVLCLRIVYMRRNKALGPGERRWRL